MKTTLLTIIMWCMSGLAQAQSREFYGPKRLIGLSVGVPNVDVLYSMPITNKLYALGRLGLGVGTVSSLNERKYFQPYDGSLHRGVMLPEPFIANYAQIELRRFFLINREATSFSYYRNNFYLGSYWKTLVPLKYNDDYKNLKMRENHRLAFILGAQRTIGKRERWMLDMFVGAAMWFNYNFKHYSPGIVVSNKFIYIITKD